MQIKKAGDDLLCCRGEKQEKHVNKATNKEENDEKVIAQYFACDSDGSNDGSRMRRFRRQRF